ncbi:hypothetical protein [Dyadobacter luticola]|uniref:Uncharacterized protein n=1 Tax=Dyadobacter luticola TaxID=1979387 RepID=A0A5R9KZL7_9BACT|nr:hypothetical protein [Dyadobacter luticola]TLV01530.1 hypothetical protein FEN17_19080 [Dyadobacter luticola]
MKSGKFSGLFLILLSIVFSCHDSELKPYGCEAPSLITADQSCNTGQGLKLTATVANKSLSLDWTVIAVKDSAAKGWSGNDRTIEETTATQSYTVPDSLTQKYKTLIVRATAICPAGNMLYSKYYRLIQVKSTTGNCIVWSAVD